MPIFIEIQSHNVPIQDLYDEKIESKITKIKFIIICEGYYHNPDVMKSIQVLDKEKELIDYIIEYKKSKNFEFDLFRAKKIVLEKKISVLIIK